MHKIGVLHIIKTLGLGGAEVNLLNLLRTIDRSRFKLHVAYSFGGELEPKFQEAGVQLFKYADEDHRVKSLATLGIILRLAAYILNNKIKIIHTHTFSAHIWGSAAAKLTGCKIVEHVHDFRYLSPEEFSRRRGFNNQYKFVHKFKNVSDRVVVLTRQNKEFLIKEKIYLPERIKEYQNGIPQVDLDPQAEIRQQMLHQFQLDPKSLIVLTPIRIAPEKNIDLILRIAPKVIKHFPNAVFLIAGDGPLYEESLNRIEHGGLKNNIKMIGYYPNIERLLQGSDIFFLPSFLELHSIAILEAMSMQVPVVVSKDVGCNSEFITHGYNGFLLDPFKDDDWAEILMRLLNNPALRVAIAANGRKTCHEKFDIKDVAKKFEDLYVELTVD
jgi:glycosyltransferase involved in cell wall biosynthesis